MPGTSIAVPQVPFVSSTTNACERPEPPSLYSPPAVQLPSPAHEIELMSPVPPLSRAPIPGIECAVPQAPFVSSTRNPCSSEVPSMYVPPAAQLPVEGHEIVFTTA